MNIIKYKGLDVNPTHLHETVNIQAKKPRLLKLGESTGAEEYLMPRIEAIHAGATLNYNHYLADKLKGDPLKKSGVYSWVQPYAKPVIFNHDTDTEVTGRIMHAAYADYTQAGRPGIILIPKISEPKAVESLKAGRLLTVSVGATTNEAICSVCGTDIINEGYCGHMKGEEYEGRVCEWIAGDIWFDELSWVNVPADQDAMVVDTESSIFLDGPQEEKSSHQESYADHSLSETFGVPKGVRLIVPTLQEELDNAPAEKQGQEESEGMPIKDTEKPVLDPEVTEEPIVVSEEPAVTEEPIVTEPETEPTTVEPEEEPEATEGDAPEEGEEPEGQKEDEPIIADPVVVENDESALEVEVQGLRNQVEALSLEIKTMLVERISEIKKVNPELKESYTNRLRERSIDSLKDTLEDLSESTVPEKVKEQEAPRQVTKVSSPVPTKEKELTEKTATEDEKINMYKKMLGL